MPKIKPVSDLRDYNKVLEEVEEYSPVYLTKNGRGKYAIIDIDEYEKMEMQLKLLTKLMKSEISGYEKGYLSHEEVMKSLGIDK